MLDAIAGLPLLGFSGARSLQYTLNYRLLDAMSRILPGTVQPDHVPFDELLKAQIQLLQEDVSRIRQGLYPASVLMPDSPWEMLALMPRFVAEGWDIYRRRASKQAKDFDEQAKDYLDEVPAYYRRNFHYQGNGYLSERSAELYDLQVETLFGGTADAMRRLIIAPLKDRFPGDGKGLRFLEIGAGTGRATRFMHQAFPKAALVATDLSHPYLKVARRKLSGFARIDFLQADGSGLPFQDSQFDAVYSVFLFHELPLTARKAVIRESLRVLKPGGFLGAVDSIQRGDVPAFDPLLEVFPENYHEPFYLDYLSTPLPELIARHTGEALSDIGFLSKVCWAMRP